MSREQYRRGDTGACLDPTKRGELDDLLKVLS